MSTPATEVDPRFSDPTAVATEWSGRLLNPPACAPAGTAKRSRPAAPVKSS